MTAVKVVRRRQRALDVPQRVPLAFHVAERLFQLRHLRNVHPQGRAGPVDLPPQRFNARIDIAHCRGQRDLVGVVAGAVRDPVEVPEHHRQCGQQQLLLCRVPVARIRVRVHALPPRVHHRRVDTFQLFPQPGGGGEQRGEVVSAERAQRRQKPAIAHPRIRGGDGQVDGGVREPGAAGGVERGRDPVDPGDVFPVLLQQTLKPAEEARRPHRHPGTGAGEPRPRVLHPLQFIAHPDVARPGLADEHPQPVRVRRRRSRQPAPGCAVPVVRGERGRHRRRQNRGVGGFRVEDRVDVRADTAEEVVRRAASFPLLLPHPPRGQSRLAVAFLLRLPLRRPHDLGEVVQNPRQPAPVLGLERRGHREQVRVPAGEPVDRVLDRSPPQYALRPQLVGRHPQHPGQRRRGSVIEGNPHHHSP